MTDYEALVSVRDDIIEALEARDIFVMASGFDLSGLDKGKAIIHLRDAPFILTIQYSELSTTLYPTK